jgi:hypothetical protein
MQLVQELVKAAVEETINVPRALLTRCRHAIAVGSPEWETDVGVAIEFDAALVADIDAALA